MKKPILAVLLLALGGLGLASLFTVHETEYAIRFQLGRIVKVDYDTGLNYKIPFVNNIRKFDNRILTLDTSPELMLTSEQKYVNVDSFVKWQIVDVAKFYTSTQGNEAIALNRLHGIVSDRIRNQIASRTLAEVVSEQRVNTMKAVAEAANAAAEEFGIKVVDVRIKSIELPDDVRESVFRRMQADRQKAAILYRSEGRKAAEKIRSDADRQVQILLAEAESGGQMVRGEGDAVATRTYAQAYSQDEEFYRFYRSLEAYRTSFSSGRDTLILDPGSEFFDYFGQGGPK